MSQPPIHEERFTVRIHQTGDTGRASIAALADWMQDAATLHAARLGFSHHAMAEAGVAWVLTRMCIRMDEYPRLNEAMTLHTWPSSLDKRRAAREFRFLSAQGGQLGVATTSWIAMDVANRRLGTMPEFVASSRETHPEVACGFTGRSLPRPDADAPDAQAVELTARRADLDWNAHVNNVHLLEWALEPVPAPLPFTAPSLVDIAFRAEIRHGDGVRAQCVPHGDGQLLHGLFRLSDGKEAARMLTAW
jgi:acyl-ACP thioesterase